MKPLADQWVSLPTGVSYMYLPEGLEVLYRIGELEGRVQLYEFDMVLGDPYVEYLINAGAADLLEFHRSNCNG